MNYKFNPHVAAMERISYASAEVTTLSLDCSDGCNPYGYSPAVEGVLNTVTPHEIFDYPHGYELKDAIIRFWADYAALDRDMISYCDGSMEGIGLINDIFAKEGSVVVGIGPQFSDYVTNAKAKGLTYRPVNLRAEDNYRISTERMIAALEDDVALVYIDRPHNPTGQCLPLAELEKILQAAREKGICVISDEAYGEYIECSDSAMTLLAKYENLIVLRTFSKGLGLAGMRIGYIAACYEITSQITKIINPYAVSSASRKMAVAALSDPAFLAKCREQTAQIKKKLHTCVGKNLSMAETLDTCSICMLTHKDPQVNLAEEFKRFSIKTVSGSGFAGLGVNSIRLRVPCVEQEAQLLEAVKYINEH